MFERFADLSKEQKANLTMTDLTVSEIRFIIIETVFAKEVDGLIAELRFIRSCSQAVIAEKIGYEQERSVQERLISIKERMLNTIQKII
jgi:hypothetical protein